MFRKRRVGTLTRKAEWGGFFRGTLGIFKKQQLWGYCTVVFGTALHVNGQNALAEWFDRVGTDWSAKEAYSESYKL